MLSILKKIWGRPAPATNFADMVAAGALIIDVRSADEYNSGHLKGAVNYPLGGLTTQIPELKKLKRPLITVCRSGQRSRMAQMMLVQAGLDVHNGGPWTQLQVQLQTRPV